jgi:hypothetical protein
MAQKMSFPHRRRADHCQPAEGFRIEGKDVVPVLQQHGRLCRGLAGKLSVRWAADCRVWYLAEKTVVVLFLGFCPGMFVPSLSWLTDHS